ncbi:hypothetical protein ACFSX9_04230 [Flavobacterium ardleyense]|uniref:Uncharacterized protein n=1 Tax=Flavobacterium ardleyense TaxID=2038737 RepID=A0ABW5Z515_9FLAO
MKKLLFTFFISIICSNVFAVNYPITPRPLRKLVSESEIIVIGNVISVVDKKHEGKKKKNIYYRQYKIAKIKILEVLQGKITNDTIEVLFEPNMSCPAPARYYENSSVVSFLDYKNGEYSTHALNYGSKTLESIGIETYKKRIIEIQDIFKINDSILKRKETIEWLVKCSENESTRWEGVYELVNHKEFSNDKENGYSTELNNNQKARLKKAYLESLDNEYFDFDLSDLLYSENKDEIDSILIDKLKKLPKENYYFASEFITRISNSKKSLELEKLLEKYYEIQYENNKTSERDKIVLEFILLVSE